MGYYTDFIIKSEGLTAKQLKSELISINEYLDPSDFDDEWGNEEVQTCLKWYEYSKDINKLSLKYPEILFIITGDGENREDVWREYHLGGKSYIDMIDFNFPEFDKEKLV